MRRFSALSTLVALLFLHDAQAGRPEAESAVREGDALLQRRDFDGAIAAYSRAIEADRGWAETWGKRGIAKRYATRFDSALDDLTTALSIDPANYQLRLQRGQAYINLDRNVEAIEEGEWMTKQWPQDPTALSLHGWALVRAGDVDRGLEMQTKALQMAGGNNALRIRADAFLRKADWKSLLEEMEVAISAGQGGAHVNKVIALTELGQWDLAEQAVAKAGESSRGTIYYMAKVYLLSTPGGPKHNAPEALKEARNAAGNSTESSVLTQYGRALFLNDHVAECIDLLSTKGRRTSFEVLFWLGAAHWKLGQFAEARELLKDARRLNPYLVKHAERIAGLKDFIASIDREMAGEGAQGGEDRAKLGHELATHLLTVAEIETLVRRYQFARALEEYRKLLPMLKSAVRKGEVETRIPEVEGMAGAHGKLIAAVNKGLKPKTKVGKSDLTIEKATELIFDFTLAKGEGKFPWAFLETSLYCDLASQQNPTPSEMFGLGCLAWDAQQRPIAAKFFEEAVKKKADLKKNIDVFISRRKGISLPPGGFVLFRGGYVTAEEKTNLEKGLVPFEGQWVTAKDREQLAKGNIQVAGKWMPGEEAELLRRGFRKHAGKWMSREDYEALRGQWADAHTEETAHYIVKTNESEAFAKDMAALAEAGYLDFKKFYGGEEPKLPGKEKMQLWGFKTYEDYRKYCVENKAEEQLNAAGFARSDSNTVVGWNKTGNRQQFLQTMIHEAAHLYWFRVAPMARAPSWHAEGMATYFEGFSWDGKGYRFNHLSESRLPFARDAMKGNRHIPLKDLLDGNALALINSDTNKALLFYAECWALNYFLSETDNPAYKAAYQDFRKAIAAGQQKSLLEFFPDAAKLEADWIRFVTGL